MTAQRPRILVVDDEPGNIRVLARALGDGYDIRFATSGEQALATVAEREIDLPVIFTDFFCIWATVQDLGNDKLTGIILAGYLYISPQWHGPVSHQNFILVVNLSISHFF